MTLFYGKFIAYTSQYASVEMPGGTPGGLAGDTVISRFGALPRAKASTDAQAARRYRPYR